jgi:hypothetical protein
MVLAGDFNTHGQCGDPRCTEWMEATYWEEIIPKHGLGIGNDNRPAHNCMRNESGGGSIIDLTMANYQF